MGFTPNPRFTSEVRRGREMGSYLASVAQDAAREVEAEAPSIVKTGRWRIEGVVVDGKDGPEGEVRVRSSFWHWPEYGTVKSMARPYFRPAVLKVLDRVGGRFGAIGK
jgi:hypothetical protein